MDTLTRRTEVISPRPFTVIECGRRFDARAGWMARERGEPTILIQRNPKTISLIWDCEVKEGGLWEWGTLSRPILDQMIDLIMRSAPSNSIFSETSGIVRRGKPEPLEELVSFLRSVTVVYREASRLGP